MLSKQTPKPQILNTINTQITDSRTPTLKEIAQSYISEIKKLESGKQILSSVLGELSCQIQGNKGAVSLAEIKVSLQKKITAIEDIQKNDFISLQDSLPREHSEATSAEGLLLLTKNISKYNRRQLGYLHRKKVLRTLHEIIEQIDGDPDEKSLRAQIECKVLGVSKVEEIERELKFLLLRKVWEFNGEKTGEHNVNGILVKLGFHYASELTENARVYSWKTLQKYAFERKDIPQDHVFFEANTRAYIRKADGHCVILNYLGYVGNNSRYKLLYYGRGGDIGHPCFHQIGNQVNTTSLDLKNPHGIRLYEGLLEVAKNLAEKAPCISISRDGEVERRCSIYQIAEHIANHRYLPVALDLGEGGLYNHAHLTVGKNGFYKHHIDIESDINS